MTNEVEVYTTKRIQMDSLWFYTVDNFNRDTGLYGISINYHEYTDNNPHTLVTFSIASIKEAKAIAQTMLELVEELEQKGLTEY